VPLHEWTRTSQGQAVYSFGAKPPTRGNWQRSAKPLGHVWPLPVELKITE